MATKIATNFTAAAYVARSRCGFAESGDIFMRYLDATLRTVFHHR
jgi:hypothetical protein